MRSVKKRMNQNERDSIWLHALKLSFQTVNFIDIGKRDRWYKRKRKYCNKNQFLIDSHWKKNFMRNIFTWSKSVGDYCSSDRLNSRTWLCSFIILHGSNKPLHVISVNKFRLLSSTKTWLTNKSMVNYWACRSKLRLKHAHDQLK